MPFGSATALRLPVPRKHPLPTTLLKVFTQEFYWRNSQRLGKFHQLDSINAALATLTLGHEGLGVSKTLRQIDLRHTHALAGRLENGQQELVVGVVGR